MMSGNWSVSLASYKEKSFSNLVFFLGLSRQIQSLKLLKQLNLESQKFNIQPNYDSLLLN